MKTIDLNSRRKETGQALVLVIIVLVVVGGGLWYLYSQKATMDREAHLFGHEVIQKLAVEHDPVYLAEHLGPQAKLDNPPSQQQYIIQRFTQLGVPSQPIQIEDSVTFESYFFEPRGYFTAHLNYAAQSGTLQIAVSHPVSRWQIDNVTFGMGSMR
jgi:hypothetical protein